MNRGAIRDLARMLLGEPSAARWSDAELNNLINYGLEDFCNQTELFEGIYTDSQVAYQADYSWPTNLTKIKRIEVVKGNAAYDMTMEDLDEHFTGIVKTTQSPPEGVNIFGQKIRLRERPSSAAAATTLNGDITASATSITLTDSSSFSRTGRLIIGSEVIAYWNNTISTGVLSPCERGIEGTTAAAHTSGDAVTLRDIWIYGIRRNGDLSTDTSSPSFPTQFHQALSFYAGWIARMKTKDYDLAAGNKQVYDEYVAKGIDFSRFKVKKRYSPK